ncbi:MAG: polyamine aminopropyltransferase [Actinomycetota bacterium]
MTRFFETPAPGLEQAYEGTLLHEERSAFQHIEVYSHQTFGNMLVLDGLVQTTIKDEFCYHEMLTHVPLISHEDPKRVLIIGGGDGGTLRRVLEHPGVETAVMIEIDERVTEVCKKYLPQIAGGAFSDPRATVLFEDGNAYIHDTREPFDAIIVDSSDPVGPGVVLFSTEFYEACLSALNPNGVLSAQIGTPFYFPDEFKLAVTNARASFPRVAPYLGAVPTYPGTTWGFMLCGDQFPIDAGTAMKRATERGIQSRYWTPRVNEAAFALPRFVDDVTAGTQVFDTK